MALKDLVSKGVRPEGGSEPTLPTPGPEPTPAPRPAPRSSAPAALLDASVEFRGTMRCRESIRIDGRCEGELHCEHSVIVGQPAVLRMSIEADAVTVAGEVNGDITARRKITLEPTARVNGNLRTPGIVIQEGAKLEGRILIGTDGAGARSEKAKPAAREATAADPQPAASPTRKPPTPSALPPVS